MIRQKRTKNEQVTAVHLYGAKVVVDGSEKDLVAVVKEDGNGTRYYDHSYESVGAEARNPKSKSGLSQHQADDKSSLDSIAQG